MQTVKLTPKTRKGRNVVSRDGNLFRVVGQRDQVQFSTQAGPWLHVEPINRPWMGRWVHSTDDKDFTFIIITEA